MKNDRPFQLQTFFFTFISKVIESIVHDQTNKFLSQNNFLCNFKPAFRPSHSTNLCLPHLKDNILKRFDENLLTAMMFIDLEKAFDKINHKVWLQKLKAIRFSEQSVQWFRSYLCDQKVLVETRNKVILEIFLMEFLRVPS